MGYGDLWKRRWARRSVLLTLLLTTWLSGAATSMAGRAPKRDGITLKDFRIKPKRLPRGWTRSEARQAEISQPEALFEDPSLLHLIPQPAQRTALSLELPDGGLSTLYIYLYPDRGTAEQALPLVMGYLWGVSMAPSPERPVEILHCGNAVVVVAGGKRREVAAWLQRHLAKRMALERASGEPVEIP